MIVSPLVWLIGVHCALFTGLASAQPTVTLTSSVEQDGRQAACLGEVVIFTCNLTEATGLQWVAEPFIPQDDPLDFAASATVDAALTDTSGQFRAVLVTIMTRVGGTADFTSELIVTASSIMRTVIQCSSVLLTASVNKTLIPAVSPSPPQLQQPNYSVSLYYLINFTVAVQWESPASDGGVGIDNYTFFSGAGITAPLTVLSNEPLMATLTLSYNEMHMVSITASNCAGESTASVVTIHEVGCGLPNSPPLGSLEDFTSSPIGAVVAFQCNPGLVLSQQMMSVCIDGIWTPDPAELVCRADCGVPSRPVNGDVMVHDSTVEGSSIVFQCSPGFAPSQQMMSVCVASGNWTPDPANLTCMPPPPGDCGVPANPTNGTIAYTTTTEGSQATFQCRAGLVPGEMMTAVCEDSEGVDRWSPDPGDLSCSQPGPAVIGQAGGLSTAEAVGIAIVLSSIVSFTAGLLVALVTGYCYTQKQKKTSPRDPPQPVTLYEEVSVVTSKDIELKENIAYGPVSQ